MDKRDMIAPITYPSSASCLRRSITCVFLTTIMALAISSAPVFARDDTGDEALDITPIKQPTVQEKVPKDIIEDPNNSFLTLTVENDLFGSGKDGNYTSGILLTYYNAASEPQTLAEWLEDAIPTFSINETTSVYYSIGQNLYTPDDITIRAPQPNERPWAAFLYGTMGLSSLTDNHIDDVSASLGVVGPMAMGSQTQEAIHDIVNTRDPSGWDNQLENEPGLLLSWRRRWPQAYSADLYGLAFAVEPNINTSLGNIYTFAGTGFTLRLAPQDNVWQDTPTQVQPSIPGNGYFETQKKGIGWYLFGGIQGRAIARNIFLDGNTFRDSPSVDKKPFVLDLNAGIALTYGNTRLSYTAVYRTKEFDTQSNDVFYAGLSIGYKF